MLDRPGGGLDGGGVVGIDADGPVSIFPDQSDDTNVTTGNNVEITMTGDADWDTWVASAGFPW